MGYHAEELMRLADSQVRTPCEHGNIVLIDAAKRLNVIEAELAAVKAERDRLREWSAPAFRAIEYALNHFGREGRARIFAVMSPDSVEYLEGLLRDYPKGGA